MPKGFYLFLIQKHLLPLRCQPSIYFTTLGKKNTTLESNRNQYLFRSIMPFELQTWPPCKPDLLLVCYLQNQWYSAYLCKSLNIYSTAWWVCDFQSTILCDCKWNHSIDFVSLVTFLCFLEIASNTVVFLALCINNL